MILTPKSVSMQVLTSKSSWDSTKKIWKTKENFSTAKDTESTLKKISEVSFLSINFCNFHDWGFFQIETLCNLLLEDKSNDLKSEHLIEFTFLEANFQTKLNFYEKILSLFTVADFKDLSFPWNRHMILNYNFIL